jgi:hypothetical protein
MGLMASKPLNDRERVALLPEATVKSADVAAAVLGAMSWVIGDPVE